MVFRKRSIMFPVFCFYGNNYSIRLDFSNVRISLFLAIIVGRVLVFIMYYIKKEERFKIFLPITLLFTSSIIILLASNRFLAFLIRWDGLGITSFLLIVYYSNWTRLNNGLLTLFLNRYGDSVLLLLSTCLLLTNKARIVRNVAVYLLIVIRLTKSAVFPFSSWLPAAISAPTPISALVHSSTLVTAGVVLLLHSYPRKIRLSYSYILFTLGRVTMILSGLLGIIEMDLKKIIALSTISQMALLIVILRMSYYWLVLFHMVVHSVIKSLLFFSVGNIIHRERRNQLYSYYNKRGFISKLNPVIIIVSSISLRGLMFLNCAFRRDSFVLYLFTNHKTIILLLTFFVKFLTVAYRIKIVSTVIINKFPKRTLLKDTSSSYIISVSFLVTLRIVLGPAYIGSILESEETKSYKFTIILLLIVILMCVLYSLIDFKGTFISNSYGLTLFFYNKLNRLSFIKRLKNVEKSLLDFGLFRKRKVIFNINNPFNIRSNKAFFFWLLLFLLLLL